MGLDSNAVEAEMRHKPSTLVPPGFAAARTFAGHRPGFVFKTGVAGPGYYPDDGGYKRPAEKAQPADGVSLIVEEGKRRRCHYDVLGIMRDASEDAIRRAYHRKALELHPDRSKAAPADAAAAFQEVQAAYAVLSDGQERHFYDLNREAILREFPSQMAEAAAAANPKAAEPPPMELFGFFSSAAYAGFKAGPRGFYDIYSNVFDELAAEERDLLKGGDGASEWTAPPRFGDAASDWAVPKAFYAHWAAFRTGRTYASEDRHSALQLERANKQRRKAMDRENHKLRAEARRQRDECVRALCAYVRKRDPRVAAHQADEAAQVAARPTSKAHEARVRRLMAEIEAGEEEEEEEEDDDASATKAAKGGAVEASDSSEESSSSAAEEEDDDDALRRMMATMTSTQQSRKARAAAVDEVDEEEESGGTPAHEPLAPPPPRPPEDAHAQGGRQPPEWHASSKVKPKPALNPKKKERDPEAAARAAEGIRMRRLQDGLGCKVCGECFHSRKELLKHIEKTGHVRDPSEAPGGLPNGMFFIPDGQNARTLKGQLLIE